MQRLSPTYHTNTNRSKLKTVSGKLSGFIKEIIRTHYFVLTAVSRVNLIWILEGTHLKSTFEITWVRQDSKCRLFWHCSRMIIQIQLNLVIKLGLKKKILKNSWTHSTLKPILWGRYFHSHFTDEETDVYALKGRIRIPTQNFFDSNSGFGPPNEVGFSCLLVWCFIFFLVHRSWILFKFSLNNF